jgi:hypothetical protein
VRSKHFFTFFIEFKKTIFLAEVLSQKKKIYLKLYETTKQERDLYKIKFERAMRYIKKH